MMRRTLPVSRARCFEEQDVQSKRSRSAVVSIGLKEALVIHAVGDIGPKRAEPASIFDSVAARLSEADIL